MRIKSILSAFAVALAEITAQEVHAGSVLLKNGIIHTVSGDDLNPGAILIKEGRIAAVAAEISEDADETIDLEGKHVYPGLIAAATSLGLLEISAVRATRDYSEVGEFTPDVQSWTAVNPDSELLPVARANGISHIVPVPMGGVVSGMSAVVALHGWTSEEMAIKAPAALHIFWPSMELDLRSKEQAPDKSKWKSLEDQADERRAKIQAIDDFFSEAEAYAKARSAGRSAIIPAWEAMVPFVEGKIPLMIRADEIRQIKSAVEWSRSRQYRMILAGGRDAWMCADLLASNSVPVVFERIYNQDGDLGATPARDIDPYDVHYTAPAVLHKAGVKVIIGTGLGGDAATGIRNLPYDAAQAIAFGLPEDAALKALTLHPAEALGIADHLGSIEPGKEATLFVSDNDLFDIRGNVTAMWIHGARIDLDTRHTRLYNKYKNRPRPN